MSMHFWPGGWKGFPSNASPYSVNAQVRPSVRGTETDVVYSPYGVCAIVLRWKENGIALRQTAAVPNGVNDPPAKP